MTKRKGRPTVLRRENFILFLSSLDVTLKLHQVKLQDFMPISPTIADLMATCGRLLGKSITTVVAFLCELHQTTVYQKKVNPSYKAILYFKSVWKQHLVRSNGISYGQQNASHWEKRRKIYELGITASPFWGRSLLPLVGDTRPFRLKLVERPRAVSRIKLRQVINEVDFPGRAGILASAEGGYYVVSETESVLFYSWDERGNFKPELVIIRGVASSAPFADAFYAWLKAVVDEACHERRNVRPTHPGHISQVGLNNGPWHARVIGLAKSYTKRLDTVTQIEHDREIIGAVSITWSIIRSVMPREVLEHVDDCLEKYGLPRLATRNVAPGHGFNIQIGERDYGFPTAERAPPEAYLSRDYEAWLHTDAAYCTWAFSFCVARDCKAQAQNTSPSHLKRSTRSSTRANSGVQASEPDVPGGGGSFVDASLRVVVCQARGTVIAFQPNFPHGTSKLAGSSNSIISINFSERVGEAWEQAYGQNKVFIESAPGAGEGNTAD